MHLLAWSPGIGDPTFVGWFTVFAYLLSSYACLLAMQVEKSGPRRPLSEFVPALFRVLRKSRGHAPLPARKAFTWFVLGAMMFALAINKQLDLQTLVTVIGRAVVRQLGLYDVRRQLQLVFIFAAIAASGLAAVLLFLWTRGVMRDFRRSLIGFSLICAFVAIRASSFHHLDRFIHTDFFGFRANWVLELGGIFLVTWGALARVQKARRSSRQAGGAQG